MLIAFDQSLIQVYRIGTVHATCHITAVSTAQQQRSLGTQHCGGGGPHRLETSANIKRLLKK
jgi:hypothetical protein